MRNELDIPASRILTCTWIRVGVFLFGLVCVGLGIIGMFLPVMPSTIFFLIGLWAFSRSSVRFHDWLYNHPRFGQSLRDWHQHRAIPLKAKMVAVGLISLSFVVVLVLVAQAWLLILVGAILGVVVVFIITRPHNIPALRQRSP